MPALSIVCIAIRPLGSGSKFLVKTNFNIWRAFFTAHFGVVSKLLWLLLTICFRTQTARLRIGLFGFRDLLGEQASRMSVSECWLSFVLCLRWLSFRFLLPPFPAPVMLLFAWWKEGIQTSLVFRLLVQVMGSGLKKHVYFAVSEVCLSGCNMLRQQWERQISFGCGCNLPVCQDSNQSPCPSPGDGVWQKFVIWI